jgi:hypothetical protein
MKLCKPQLEQGKIIAVLYFLPRSIEITLIYLISRYLWGDKDDNLVAYWDIMNILDVL